MNNATRGERNVWRRELSGSDSSKRRARRGKNEYMELVTNNAGQSDRNV